MCEQLNEKRLDILYERAISHGGAGAHTNSNTSNILNLLQTLLDVEQNQNDDNKYPIHINDLSEADEHCSLNEVVASRMRVLIGILATDYASIMNVNSVHIL